MERLTVANGLRALAVKPSIYRSLFTHGTLDAGLYAPRGTDPQRPHDRDEVYVIASGSGTFFHAGKRTPFEPGEVLFVPAGAEHRFEDFSDDFSTWVFFYGPTGGEPAG